MGRFSVRPSVRLFIRTSPPWAIQPDLRPSQPGLRPSQPGLRPSQPSLRPSQPGLRPNQPGLRPNQPGLRPSQPGLAGWPGGGMYGQTDGRTYKQTDVRKISPFYRTLSPIRAAALPYPMKTKENVEQGKGTADAFGLLIHNGITSKRFELLS